MNALEDFKRVCLLVIKGLDETAIARATNPSPALMKTYQSLHAQAATLLARGWARECGHGR